MAKKGRLREERQAVARAQHRGRDFPHCQLPYIGFGTMK
jgi:hypothetical protein